MVEQGRSIGGLVDRTSFLDRPSIEDLRRKAEAGDAEAQTTLGVRVAQSGDPDARSSAERWFRLAAEQGLARAKHNLGVLYFRDGGAPSAVAEAKRWFGEAARDGWLASAHILGLWLYEEGLIEEAKAQLEYGAKLGHGTRKTG
ncbi:MAG: uncharacterized protein QOK29_4832 [Rhodospirillaceae bacterium]|jgi:TPR repeat protein|nr:uncharacterized protein [Rhodospirillaceae bacterium]